MLSLWIPAKTIIVVVGVLHWQQQNLTTYPEKDRQDKKLYEIFLERGVPTENILFIEDEQATLSNIQDQTIRMLKKSDENTTFIFYYAGHGSRAQDGKEAFFLNYDVDANNLEKTALSLQWLGRTIRKNFKGKTAILSADCCYSGSLNMIADSLQKSGIGTLVLSSAVASNTSTSAWTFTESLNDLLSGKPFLNITKGEITVEMAADYIQRNLAYADHQKSNFYRTKDFPRDFIISSFTADYTDMPHIGEIGILNWQGTDYTVMIRNEKSGQVQVRFFGYPEVWSEWFNYTEIRKIPSNTTYSIGSKVQVEWEGTWYPATILKVDAPFHYIHYTGYGSEWDEWVCCERIKP